MNYFFFAGGFYAPLNGLCFALTTICGYFITKHFYGIDRKSSGFQFSLFVGFVVGILLILHDPHLNPRAFRYVEPESSGRLLIGLVGACLGYFFYQVQVSQTKKDPEQKSSHHEELFIDETSKSD